jgi:hypothetical protein
MRDLIDILDEEDIDETALTPGQINHHWEKYLGIVIQMIEDSEEFEVDGKQQEKYGKFVTLHKSMLPELNRALTNKTLLPKKITFDDGTLANWGILFKSVKFTSAEGQKKYNTGHLSELVMGLAVATKIKKRAKPITTNDVLAFLKGCSVEQVGANYRYFRKVNITYPKTEKKTDKLEFLAVMPARSANEFNNQVKANKFEHDIESVLNSSIRYANEIGGVANAYHRIEEDDKFNVIKVTSDGSSDAKGTKVDIKLEIDDIELNLISLKTFSSSTLGQISGIKFDSVARWFDINFGIDISSEKKRLDPGMTQDQALAVIIDIYDEIIIPQVKTIIGNQSPREEAGIVQRLADAANYYARGDKLEDVEVVKLDDKIKTGNYKILRFSDNLYELMQDLDLDVKIVDKSAKSRTVQIFVKPEDSKGGFETANKLCQFRTFKAGKSVRSFFETGEFLEAIVSAPTTPTAGSDGSDEVSNINRVTSKTDIGRPTGSKTTNTTKKGGPRGKVAGSALAEQRVKRDIKRERRD